jgi:hypothetical protein
MAGDEVDVAADGFFEQPEDWALGVVGGHDGQGSGKVVDEIEDHSSSPPSSEKI